MKLRERELTGSVNRHEEVKPSLLGLHLGDVDVKEPDRIGFEALLWRLVALDLGQSADTVALQAAMQ